MSYKITIQDLIHPKQTFLTEDIRSRTIMYKADMAPNNNKEEVKTTMVSCNRII